MQNAKNIIVHAKCGICNNDAVTGRREIDTAKDAHRRSTLLALGLNISPSRVYLCRNCGDLVTKLLHHRDTLLARNHVELQQPPAKKEVKSQLSQTTLSFPHWGSSHTESAAYITYFYPSFERTKKIGPERLSLTKKVMVGTNKQVVNACWNIAGMRTEMVQCVLKKVRQEVAGISMFRPKNHQRSLFQATKKEEMAEFSFERVCLINLYVCTVIPRYLDLAYLDISLSRHKSAVPSKTKSF